jgi:hypothetical protein
MPGLRRILVFLFLLLTVGLTAYLIVRAVGGRQPGPAVALCPGPDGYGYRCTGERLLEYVDAGNDSQLYVDDGLVRLDLPFTFTFYGAEYEQLSASSNGNLQFDGGENRYDNVCLAPELAAGMGDMIAPYWDDLNLAISGFLQTEVVGQAPERVFVVEWEDVPRFGTQEDQLTFEVQLFEGSNDIVFLYRDVQTLEGANGSQATIGLQSERLGYAIQAGCNQIAVNNGSTIRFQHPAEADVAEPAVARPQPLARAHAKGLVADLMETLDTHGTPGLDSLQLAWRNRRPPLELEWLWADLDGDGAQELVALWQSDPRRPDTVEMAVIRPGNEGRWQPQWQSWPLARQERLRSLALLASSDLTGDGHQEVILRDQLTGSLLVLRLSAEEFDLLELPGRCSGSVLLQDTNGDGAFEVIRGGCPGGERWSIHWDGHSFVVSERG